MPSSVPTIDSIFGRYREEAEPREPGRRLAWVTRRVYLCLKGQAQRHLRHEIGWSSKRRRGFYLQRRIKDSIESHYGCFSLFKGSECYVSELDIVKPYSLLLVSNPLSMESGAEAQESHPALENNNPTTTTTPLIFELPKDLT